MHPASLYLVCLALVCATRIHISRRRAVPRLKRRSIPRALTDDPERSRPDWKALALTIHKYAPAPFDVIPTSLEENAALIRFAEGGISNYSVEQTRR